MKPEIKQGKPEINQVKLEIEQVGKCYDGKLWALRDLSLTLNPGVIGLLGPAGSGKSTLVRILTTVTLPTKGRVIWDGVDIAEFPDELRATLGYLPQDFGVYPNLTLQEFMEYLAGMKGLAGRGVQRRIEEVLYLVNLCHEQKRLLSSFTGSMKQRAGLAQALLSDPEVLVLDEPTFGLDLEERARFRGLLTQLTCQSRIILVATQFVADVEETATELALLREGRLVAHDVPEALLQAAEGKVWQWTFGSRDLPAVRHRWLVSAIVRSKEGVTARILSEVSPSPDAVPVLPTLTDAYLLAIAPARKVSRIA